MALPHTVTSLEAIDEKFRTEYVPVDAADPTKGFKLDVTGLPEPEDTGALKRALDRVRAEKDEAVKKAEQLGKTSQDIDSLRKDYDAKLAALASEKENVEKAAADTLRKAAKTTAITDVTAELFGPNAEIMAPHVAKRIRVDVEGTVTTVRVLDKEGKLSSSTLEDLKKELRADPKLAPVLIATRGSGSGARQDNNASGGAGGSGGTKPKHPGPSASPAQIAAFVASLPG